MGKASYQLLALFSLMGLIFCKTSSMGMPVRWTPAITLTGLEQLSDKFKEKIIPEGSPGLTLFRNGSPRAVLTCESYLQARDEGFESFNPSDWPQETLFKFQCKTLQWMGRARAARSSGVSDYEFSERSLDELPSCMGMPEDSETENRMQEAMVKGLSLRRFDPTAQISKNSEYSLSIKDSKETMTLELLAWADFNGDGPEDLLIFVSDSALKENYREYYHVVLTRSPGQDLFRVIKDDSGRCPIQP
jgi:hypothetical protein